MNFKDLICTPNGRVSHLKLWSNIGNAVASFIVIWYSVKELLTWDMFVVYLGAVAGANAVHKFLDLRHAATKTEEVKKEGE